MIYIRLGNTKVMINEKYFLYICFRNSSGLFRCSRVGEYAHNRETLRCFRCMLPLSHKGVDPISVGSTPL